MNRTCRICGATVNRCGARGLCQAHYNRFLHGGLIRSGLIDAAPVRARIGEHVDRGRTCHGLADLADVQPRTIMKLYRAQQIRVQRRIALAIFDVPVPPTEVGARRRIRALARLGWNRQHVADAAGITVYALKCRRLSATTCSAVAAAYTELRWQQGPCVRTRNHATRHGWPSPLGWDDDIDDPGAQPNGVGPATRPNRKAHPEDVAWLDSFGFTDEAIAARLGVQVGTVQTARRRSVA